MTKYIFTILLLSVFATSSSAQGNLKSYYFKLKDFRQPMVYVMSSPEDPEFSRYFHMESMGDTLITKIYDWEGNLAEESFEVYGKKGSQLVEVNLFYFGGQDEIMQNQMDFESVSYVYYWKPDGPYFYKATVDLEYGEEDKIMRERIPGTTSRKVVMGKKRKMVHFQDILSVEGPAFDPFTFTNDVYYAKKLGIVQIDMHLPDAELSLFLTEILTESEWIQRIR